MELKLNSQNFEEEVLKSEQPVLVDFYADWCGPCKMMGPLVKELADTLEGKCRIGKCNVDENMELAQKYGIASIPAFLIFQHGEVKDTVIGAVNKTVLEEKLTALL